MCPPFTKCDTQCLHEILLLGSSDLGLVHWDGINAFFILKMAYNLKGVNFESLKQRAFADHSLLTLLLPLARKPTVRGSNAFGHTTQRNGLSLFN